MFVIIATGVIVILLVISSFDNNKNSSYNDYNPANFCHMGEEYVNDEKRDEQKNEQDHNTNSDL